MKLVREDAVLGAEFCEILNSTMGLTEIVAGPLFRCLLYWRNEVASNQCGHVRFIQRNSIRLNTMDAARNAQGVHEGTESPVART